MSLTLIPISTKAFTTPCGTDDSKWEEFGPRPSTLLIKIYTGGYTAEIADFKAKGIDIEDWPLSPGDYQYFASNDPNHLQWSTALNSEFGLYEYDFNDQVAPMNIKSFRQALSYLLDKDYFISLYLAGAAAKADSPIASCTGWYNPACTDMYNKQPRTTMNLAGTGAPDDVLDLKAAYDMLIADMGQPVTDPYPNAGAVGSLYWTWTSPFNDDPGRSTAPAFIKDGHLLVFARSDSSNARLQQGAYLKQLLEQSLPNYMITQGLAPAHINVDLFNVPRATTSKEVMSYYRFHAYTGGWSLSATPDFLQFYTTAYIIKPTPNAHNYGCYSNPNYDSEVALLLSSVSIGDPLTPCTGKYHSYVAQLIIMGDQGLEPMWYAIAYKGVLSNWHNTINALGVGFNNWYTFLDMYKTGNTELGGDTVRYGFQSDWENGNVITATWYWDWEVLGKIYDTLLASNPYNPNELRAALADNWTIGTWGSPAKSVLTFHLREDVFWQDVPAKDRSAYTFDKGHELDGPFINYPLTVLDVAHAIEYIRDRDVWTNTQTGYLAGNVDHVGISTVYNETNSWPYWNAGAWPIGPEWYNSTYIASHAIGGNPWDYNYVQFDKGLEPETIKIYLSDTMGWLAYFRIGGIPITPYHIFKYLATGAWHNSLVAPGFMTPDVGLLDLSPNGADLTYGSGPYILLTKTTTDITMIAYRTGANYRGIVEQNSYFWCPVRATDLLSSPSSVSDYAYYKAGTSTLWLAPWGSTGVLVNKDPNNDMTVQVTGLYDYVGWNGAAWVPGVRGSTNTLTVTIPKGGSVKPFLSAQLTLAPNILYICIWEGYTIKYISPSPSWIWNAINGGGDYAIVEPTTHMEPPGYTSPAYWIRIPSDNDCPYYTHNYFEIMSVKARLAGDIGGGFMTDPYYGSDHTINILDINPIAANWLPPKNHVTWTGVIDPTDMQHRADINGDGTVNLLDINYIAAKWLPPKNSWLAADVAPPDPSAGIFGP